MLLVDFSPSIQHLANFNNIRINHQNPHCFYQNEVREYPPVLRNALSIGRRMQDPLAEFASLCVEEDELLCLRYHPLQVKIIPIYFFHSFSMQCNEMCWNLKYLF